MARKTNTKPATIGQRIKALRVARGKTQEALANTVGCAKSTVADIERGVNEPQPMTLEAFARALCVPVAELRGEQ